MKKFITLLFYNWLNYRMLSSNNYVCYAFRFYLKQNEHLNSACIYSHRLHIPCIIFYNDFQYSKLENPSCHI